MECGVKESVSRTQTVEKPVIASKCALLAWQSVLQNVPFLSSSQKKWAFLGERIPTVASLPRNDIDFFDTLSPLRGQIEIISEGYHFLHFAFIIPHFQKVLDNLENLC